MNLSNFEFRLVRKNQEEEKISRREIFEHRYIPVITYDEKNPSGFFKPLRFENLLRNSSLC